MPEPIRILTTKKLDPDLEDRLCHFGFTVDTQSFIDTIQVRDKEVTERLSHAVKEELTVIFTSAQAVLALSGYIAGSMPPWNVYCISAATRDQVITLLPRLHILGTAPDAARLAETIVSEKPPRPLIFFCSDRRRDEIPARLKQEGIALEELIVYKTVELDIRVEPIYDGLLFFSPSAVKSFSRDNKPKKNAALFAIGHTTAAELHAAGYINIVVAATPTQESLIQTVVEHFKRAEDKK